MAFDYVWGLGWGVRGSWGGCLLPHYAAKPFSFSLSLASSPLPFPSTASALEEPVAKRLLSTTWPGPALREEGKLKLGGAPGPQTL